MTESTLFESGGVAGSTQTFNETELSRGCGRLGAPPIATDGVAFDTIRGDVQAASGTATSPSDSGTLPCVQGCNYMIGHCLPKRVSTVVVTQSLLDEAIGY